MILAISMFVLEVRLYYLVKNRAISLFTAGPSF